MPQDLNVFWAVVFEGVFCFWLLQKLKNNELLKENTALNHQVDALTINNVVLQTTRDEYDKLKSKVRMNFTWYFFQGLKVAIFLAEMFHTPVGRKISINTNYF